MQYTVKPGNTLDYIAQKFGTTVDALRQLNPDVADSDKIFAGQTLQIPGDLTSSHGKNPKLEKLLEVLRSQIGAPYMTSDFMFTDPSSIPDDLRQIGAYCSGLFNWARLRLGLPPVGGAPAYAKFISPWEPFDPSKTYPVGTIFVNDRVGFDEAGNYYDNAHVAMVSGPPDPNRDQLLIQSDPQNGVNEERTVAETHALANFQYAGPMPDVGTM